VKTEFATSLPPVLGDKVQLQQVVLNLIVNGVEAMTSMETGPRELEIKSQLDQSGDLLVLVRDSGIGLAAGVADQMFRAFFTTMEGGIGMGLAICRSIVEAHGGRPVGAMSVQAIKASAVKFLTKPFRHQDLLDAIRVPSNAMASGVSRTRKRQG
jgi:C4-dicarboxylate-specific signal transduction histidine kinase